MLNKLLITEVYSVYPKNAREKIGFFTASLHFLHISRIWQPGTGDGRAHYQHPPSHYFKIYSYYTTSIRRNQLFFATFHSEIAKLFISLFVSPYYPPLLVISYNLIFFDGFPPVSSQKLPAFFLLWQTAHERQLFRPMPISARQPLLWRQDIPLHLQPFAPAPAFCRTPS